MLFEMAPKLPPSSMEFVGFLLLGCNTTLPTDVTPTTQNWAGISNEKAAGGRAIRTTGLLLSRCTKAQGRHGHKAASPACRPSLMSGKVPRTCGS